MEKEGKKWSQQQPKQRTRDMMLFANRTRRGFPCGAEEGRAAGCGVENNKSVEAESTMG